MRAQNEGFCCIGTLLCCLEVVRGSCREEGWPGELAGRPKAEAMCPDGGKLARPEPYQSIHREAR